MSKLLKIETKWANGRRVALIAVLRDGQRIRWNDATYAQVEGFYAAQVGA